MLFETPDRQLVPFSPFDSSLGDANMLIMAKSGGGKTFMAQLFLLMMARANPLISIIERGDSYRPLVELMGGRVIDVNLEGNETLNPWDLPPGETTPSKERSRSSKSHPPHDRRQPRLRQLPARQPVERRHRPYLQALRHPVFESHSDV